jgi:hypothetical protein
LVKNWWWILSKTLRGALNRGRGLGWAIASYAENLFQKKCNSAKNSPRSGNAGNSPTKKTRRTPSLNWLFFLNPPEEEEKENYSSVELFHFGKAIEANACSD